MKKLILISVVVMALLSYHIIRRSHASRPHPHPASTPPRWVQLSWTDLHADSYEVQTSTNLVDWVPFATILNCGFSVTADSAQLFFRVKAIDPGTVVTLAWDASAGVDGYTLEESMLPLVVTTNTRARVTGLTPGLIYRFTVTDFNIVGVSGPSNEVVWTNTIPPLLVSIH